jgi:hypothetical protein
VAICVVGGFGGRAPWPVGEEVWSLMVQTRRCRGGI